MNTDYKCRLCDMPVVELKQSYSYWMQYECKNCVINYLLDGKELKSSRYSVVDSYVGLPFDKQLYSSVEIIRYHNWIIHYIYEKDVGRTFFGPPVYRRIYDEYVISAREAHNSCNIQSIIDFPFKDEAATVAKINNILLFQ